MKKLIVVNGVPGVGKTATCKSLYKSLDGSVWLDGDWCWMMNPFVVNDENKEMVENNINHLLRNFLKNSSYQYVIFNWVIGNVSILDRILSRLGDLKFQTYKISLVCTPESLRERMISDGRPNEQVEKSIANLELYNDMKTHIIDTTNLSTHEVVDRIKKWCTTGDDLYT